MNRVLRILAAALFALACAAPLLIAPPPAEAGGATIRFFVVEWRLSYEDTTKAISMPGGAKRIPFSLHLRGRGSVHGQDKVEFDWHVEDAYPYLDILRTCGMGRLGGMVSADLAVMDAKGIDGKGPIASLSCRAILH